MRAVDLRSDTVTRPTPAMRAAMAAAEVGDDAYGEDPTVRALEEHCAALLGKESALFVPSGTMANQIALQLHCRPGDLVYAGEDAHLGRYEAGAASAYAGVQLETVPSPVTLGPGLFDGPALSGVYLGAWHDQPRPGLVALEQTHNLSGGRVFPLPAVASAAAWAREHGLPVHVDGARLWNAAVATGRPEAELVAPADTVSVCFSKGLGAPVGSLLAFASTRREDALRLRRRMGGSLRQAGVLAAAALHALRDRPDLARDHARAAALASALREVGYAVPRAPETNMVVFEVDDAPAFVAAAEQAGLRLGALDGRRIRAVTHRDLGDADLARARDVLARLAPACGDASA